MFWGFSAAASFGATFAAIHPERTIGVVRYHTHRRGLSADVQAVSRIPALLIAGANDETAGVEDAEVLWTLGRAVDAPWTFAVEPDGAHASPEIHERTLRDLTIPWIAAVLRMRLAGDSTLRPVPNDQSWFADTRTFDIGPVLRFAPDQRTANWLPDEVSAHGWRAVARPIVRSVPTDPISGAWTGHAILGTNRVPLSIDLKLDDKAVSVVLNMGGVVGVTSSGTFDRQRGRLTFEVDA